MLLAFTAEGLAAMAPLPPIPKGTPYSVTRRMLITMGYQPETVPQPRQRCAAERSDICSAYLEAEACTAAGPARCVFLWRRGDTVVEVATTGEDELVTERLRCRSGCQ